MKKLTYNQLTSRQAQRNLDKKWKGKIKIDASQYVNSMIKNIKCTCLIDGNKWESRYGNLMTGYGCPLCSKLKRWSCQEALDNLNKKHNGAIKFPNILKEYKNTSSKISCVCAIDSNKWSSDYNHLMRGGCPQCVGQKRWSPQEALYNLNKKCKGKIRFPNMPKEYKNTQDRNITCVCEIDGNTWKSSYNGLMHDQGCPKCKGGIKYSKKVIKENLENRCRGKIRFPNIFNEYKNCHTRNITCICEVDGNEWKSSYSSLMMGGGCPLCNVGWTVSSIRSFLKEIRSKLPFLSQVERRYVLAAKGLLDICYDSKGYGVITNHLATDPNLDLIEIDKFINNEPNIYDDAMETGDLSLVKDEDNGIYDATKPKEKEPSLPVISNVNSIFAGTDCLTDIISDQTIIEALINESVGKAIQQICQNEKCVEKIRKEKKKLYSKEAQNRILDLYKQAKQVKIPKDYNFISNGVLVKPNLMQRFTVVLLRKNKNLLNYSGTGAGKTLSAILAAREIGAKKTVIICPNDVIHGWKETISGVDPTANIFVNIFDPQLDLSHSNYLIFNIEKFQQPDTMDNIKCLLSSQIDFIIVDEVQMAKYRNAQKATTRNINIRALASNTRKDNPNVHVMVMSATPVVNEISEGYSILEILTGEEFDNKNNRITIENCVKLRSHIVSQGIRWVMGHRQDLNLQTIDVDATDKKEEVIKLNSRNPMDLECIFIDKKLEAIKDHIKPGTILYSLYKGSGLLNKCRKFVKCLGFSVSEYTGDQNFNLRKQIKDDFVSGKIDVLIATSPIATGVDKLQYRCNNMIIVSMSWTSAQTEQLIGRILRQGQTQDEVNVIIPICYINVKDKRWSWDQYRYNIIENKRTMSDIVVSGTIPDKHKLSDQKVLSAMLDWIKRVDDGKIIDVKRRESFVPLSEKSMEKRIRKYGDFTELNRRWNAENSDTTHKRLQQDSSEYETYHNEQQKAMKDWDVKPIDDIIVPFLKGHPDKVVGDFGSGPLAELSKKVDNKVYSFDHLDNKSTGVIGCNLSSMPKEYYNTFDIIVFSLSLMGRDFSEYLKEAKKCLTKNGILYIVECSSRIKNLQEILDGIERIGFKNIGYEPFDKFIRISAVKDDAKKQGSVKMNLGRKY